MKTTSSARYRGYPVNTGRNNDLTCNTRTLDQYIDRLEYMVKNHSKTLSVRLDIHTPVESAVPLRKRMARILESAKRKLESKNKGKNKIDMHHVWAAEQKASERNEHVHLALLVNGNAIQNGYSLKSAVESALERHLGTGNKVCSKGLVEFCGSNGKTGIMLDRNAPDFEQKRCEAVYAESYLAKTSSKEHKARGARFSSASRLPSDRR